MAHTNVRCLLFQPTSADGNLARMIHRTVMEIQADGISGDSDMMQIIFLLGHCLTLIYEFIGFNRLMETINSMYHSVSTNIFLFREKNLEIFFLCKEKY